jgi:hypothetical protein
MKGGYNSSANSFLLAIHFLDVSQFGETRMGRAGMNKFFETHRCNQYCNALKLTRPF